MKEKIEKKKTAEDLLFDEFRDGLFCPDQRDSQSKSIEPSMMDELDQQEARLKKYGLTVETKRDFTGEAENLRTMSGSTKDENDQIVEFSFHAVYAQRFGRVRTYFCDGKKIKKLKDIVTLYQVITRSQENEEPKVSDYYYEENGETDFTRVDKMTKKVIIAIMIPAIVIFMLLSFMVGGGIGGGFFMAMFFALPVAFGWLIVQFVKVFYSFFKVGELSKFTAEAGGLQSKKDEKLSNCNLPLNYEDIEEVLNKLIKKIVFSEDPSFCKNYKGEKVTGRFDDIIDLKYRGAYNVCDARKVKNGFEISVDFFVNNTLYDGSKISQKKEILHVEMYHDDHFSVSGDEYHQKVDNWVVTKLERR